MNFYAEAGSNPGLLRKRQMRGKNEPHTAVCGSQPVEKVQLSLGFFDRLKSTLSGCSFPHYVRSFFSDFLMTCRNTSSTR